MLELHAEYEFIHTVTGGDSAKILRFSGGADFPDVLATSRMIGLMEVAAGRLMVPLLKDGELSVGVGVDVKHLGATPICEDVRIKATYQGQDGKLYTFRIEAFDRGGKVGDGLHTRAIVNIDRLMEGSRKRLGNAP